MSDAKGPIQFMLGGPARLYFENLEKSSTSGKFSILLQKYWLCAQLGMVHGRKGNDDGDRKWVSTTSRRPLQSTPKTSGLRLSTNTVRILPSTPKTKKRCCPP